MPSIKSFPIKKQASDTTTLVKKEQTDPKFKGEKEHNDYFRTKALSKLSHQDKKTYDSLKIHQGQANADALIALRGGTPAYEKESYKSKPMRKVYPASGTPASNAGKTPKPQGYRYKINKPAKGSITVKSKN